MAFGYRLVSVRVSVGDTANMIEYVKNYNVGINSRHANWLQDCKLTILRPTGFAQKTRTLRI